MNPEFFKFLLGDSKPADQKIVDELNMKRGVVRNRISNARGKLTFVAIVIVIIAIAVAFSM